MRSRLAEGGAKTTTKESSILPAQKTKAAEDEWEVRPGGMLVQKLVTPSGLVPTIRVKVKHGSMYHEIYISSQATFGELKKQVSVKTGIHALDQKVFYKDKERDSAVFLDAAGVKDKSKLMVVEDPVAQAKRLIEQRRAAKLEKAAKSVSAITVEVDKLASKVSALEGIVNKGRRVAENDVLNLIELLMNQLVKLDGIAVADDSEAKLQKRKQVMAIQKYVETLDSIKIKNAQVKANAQPPKMQKHCQKNQLRQQSPALDNYRYQQQQPVAMANNWEFFDSLFMPSSSTPVSTPTSSTTTAASTASSTPSTRFEWELF